MANEMTLEILPALPAPKQRSNSIFATELLMSEEDFHRDREDILSGPSLSPAFGSFQFPNNVKKVELIRKKAASTSKLPDLCTKSAPAIGGRDYAREHRMTKSQDPSSYTRSRSTIITTTTNQNSEGGKNRNGAGGVGRRLTSSDDDGRNTERGDGSVLLDKDARHKLYRVRAEMVSGISASLQKAAMERKSLELMQRRQRVMQQQRQEVLENTTAIQAEMRIKFHKAENNKAKATEERAKKSPEKKRREEEMRKEREERVRSLEESLDQRRQKLMESHEARLAKIRQDQKEGEMKTFVARWTHIVEHSEPPEKMSVEHREYLERKEKAEQAMREEEANVNMKVHQLMEEKRKMSEIQEIRRMRVHDRIHKTTRRLPPPTKPDQPLPQLSTNTLTLE